MALGLWRQQAPPSPGAALLEGGLCLLLLGISCLGCLALSLAGVSVSWQGCRGGSSQTGAWARFLSHRGVCLECSTLSSSRWAAQKGPCARGCARLCGLATSRAASLQASGVSARPPRAVSPALGLCLATRPPCWGTVLSQTLPARQLLISWCLELEIGALERPCL